MTPPPDRVERILAGTFPPLIGDGADGARRSANIIRDELATLPTGPDQPGYSLSTEARRSDLEREAEAWDQRATDLEDGAR